MKIDTELLRMKNAETIPVVTVLDSKGKFHTMQPVVAMPKPEAKITFGIEQTLEGVVLIAAIANAVYKVAAGGWILGWVGIVWGVIPIIPKLIPAIKGMGEIVNELDDLDPMEKELILVKVKEHLLFEKDVEAIVAIALDILYKIKTLAGVFK